MVRTESRFLTDPPPLLLDVDCVPHVRLYRNAGGKDRYSLYELSDLVYADDDYEPDDEHDDAWYEDD